MTRKTVTIAWDIDDVLNDLMGSWLEQWWKPGHPDCTLSYDGITENPPCRQIDASLPEYLDSLDGFRLSGNYAELKPDPDVIEWFKETGAAYKHIALTAIPRIAAAVSAEWVIRHFGDWLRTFHFVPSERPGDPTTVNETSKSAYIKWLGRIDCFIDDHPGHVQAAAAAGTKTFLVARPWNSGGMALKEILAQLNP